MVENRKKHRQNSHLIIHFPNTWLVFLAVFDHSAGIESSLFLLIFEASKSINDCLGLMCRNAKSNNDGFHLDYRKYPVLRDFRVNIKNGLIARNDLFKKMPGAFEKNDY